MKRYIVKDNNGEPSGIPFRSIEDAECYRAVFGLSDWKIEEIELKVYRQSTDKQKDAVHFCEKWVPLNIDFVGNINDHNDCSDFLSEWLETAKKEAPKELGDKFQINAF